MKLYFMRGKGIGATLIRWFSRSKYSHVAIAFEDGTVYEAYPFKGVRKTTLKSTKGVTPFGINSPLLDSERVRQFCESELGTPYDYWGVVCFICGLKPRRATARYFCSEFAFDAVRSGGVELLERVSAWALRPDEISWSPLVYIDPVLTYLWRTAEPRLSN